MYNLSSIKIATRARVVQLYCHCKEIQKSYSREWNFNLKPNEPGSFEIENIINSICSFFWNNFHRF